LDARHDEPLIVINGKDIYPNISQVIKLVRDGITHYRIAGLRRRAGARLAGYGHSCPRSSPWLRGRPPYGFNHLIIGWFCQYLQPAAEKPDEAAKNNLNLPIPAGTEKRPFTVDCVIGAAQA
jgi:hypothetical protein